MTFSLILRLVLKRLASLPWSDFLRIVAQVPEVAKTLPIPADAPKGERFRINAQRATVLSAWIGRQFPNLTGVNFVLEVAVRYFKFREK